MEELLNGSAADIVAHLGVGGVIALTVWYYARQDARRHVAQWREASVESSKLSEKLIRIIAQNSEAISANTSVATQTETALRELRTEVTRSVPLTCPARTDGDP